MKESKGKVWQVSNMGESPRGKGLEVEDCPESFLPWGPTQRAPRHFRQRLEAPAPLGGVRAVSWEDEAGGKGG